MQDITDYGRFEIMLEDYLKRKKISKNSLVESANLQRTQLNSYCNNKIKRPDFDVLARICYALDCELADIVRYVKPEKLQGGQVDGGIK